MFKLVVLSLAIILATVSARPGLYGTPLVYTAPIVHQEYVNVHEPVITKVGAIVESVPSAVSHQSSTVVHNKGHIVTPILASGVKTYVQPIIKTYSAPILKTYDTPYLYSSYLHHH